MNRHVVAFVVAPLVVPIIMSGLAVQVLLTLPSLYWLGLMVAAGVSYAGIVLLGLPAYVALRFRGWTAFWIAPLVGFAAGVIMAISLVAVFVATLESRMLDPILAMLPDDIRNNQIYFSTDSQGGAALVAPGTLGALVGTVLWLIGRPDRP
jgi:hypothetical protein